MIRNLEAQVVGTVAASVAAGRADARIRGHRAAPRRHREVACRQPRDDPGGGAASCRERRALVLRLEAGSAAVCRRLPTICKALDELTRRSDERNTKTFEAIHDTLLKIVDRLGSLEERRQPAFAEPMPRRPRKMALRDAPSIDARRRHARSCADAATPAPAERRCADAGRRSSARRPKPRPRRRSPPSTPTRRQPSQPAACRSMFGGLSRAFAARRSAPSRR